jgi:uncharacterized protein YqgC (DUF456 family)
MYALVRTVGIRTLLTQQLPMIVASLLVMEGVIEFVGEMGSFILELSVFFVIWFVLDFLVNALFNKKASSTHHA